MGRKVMRTIHDAHEEVMREIMSTSPLLTDDYRANNIRDLEENLEEAFSDEELQQQKSKDLKTGKAKK